MFEAKVYNVFIASPGDAAELRQIAREVIQDWNDKHAETLGIILLPKVWEAGTAPRNKKAQKIVNRDALSGADLVIAIWRFLWDAETEEEVGRSIKVDSREVMQYFSDEPVGSRQPDDPRQRKLQAYREKMSSAGKPFYFTYEDPASFRELLSRHLVMKVREMMTQKTLMDVAGFTPVETMRNYDKEISKLDMAIFLATFLGLGDCFPFAIFIAIAIVYLLHPPTGLIFFGSYVILRVAYLCCARRRKRLAAMINGKASVGRDW